MKPSPYAPTLVDQVLLDVARVELGSDLRDRLAANLDWDALLAAAAWHGLESLLYRHLRDVGPLAPETVMEKLHARYLSTARRNLYLTAELNRVLAALAGAGIRTMPFKGPVAAAHYGIPALRAFGDLDVVVDWADVRSAIQVLRDLDFEPWASDIEAVLRDPAQYGLPHQRQEGAVCVDLHWCFAWGWFGKMLDFEQLWRSAQPLVLGGAEALVFSPCDQLLHMGMHGCKHGPVPWPKLKWITDMAELMSGQPPEVFEDLPAKAEAIGAGGILAFSTALVRDLLQAPVPPALDRHLENNGGVRSQLQWIADGLWTHGVGAADVGELVRFHLALRERRRDRWRFSWRRLTMTTHRDREAFHLPRSLHFLYPILRVGRLAARYADPRRLMRVIQNL